jgi:hypothetical protein
MLNLRNLRAMVVQIKLQLLVSDNKIDLRKNLVTIEGYISKIKSKVKLNSKDEDDFKKFYTSFQDKFKKSSNNDEFKNFNYNSEVNNNE